MRSNVKKAKQSKYSAHFDAKAQHKVKVGDSVIPKNAIDAAFEEFSDEIDAWIIDELKAIGCDTAKSVLAISVEDLVSRTDLEEETIRELVRILRSEFE